MKIRFGNVILTSVAMSAGIITLLGYFLGPTIAPLFYLRALLVGWAALLVAVAMCLGALNLGAVHLRKIFRRGPGWFYSLSLLVGLFTALAAGFGPWFVALIDRIKDPSAPAAANVGMGNPIGQWVFHYLQAALGTALSGLIVFFLVYAGFRLLRRPGRRLTSIVFIVVAILSLIGMAPVLLDLANPQLDQVRMWLWVWISQVPAVAGARGLLLGIALGAIATGLRVLLAIDRPYGE
jgi:hypothetical protein